MKLDVSTDIDMSLMVKKVLEVEYAMLFINMQKLIANTKKITNRHILSIGL